MTGTRRALTAAAAGLSAAGLAQAATTKVAGPNPPDTSLPAPSPLFVLLSRTSFGIRDDQWQHAFAIGYDAYLDEQLNPERIDVSALEAQLTGALPSLSMTSRELIDYTAPQGSTFLAVEE